MTEKEIFTRLLKAVTNSNMQADKMADSVYTSLSEGQKAFIDKGSLIGLFGDSDLKDAIITILCEMTNDECFIDNYLYDERPSVVVNDVRVYVPTDDVYDACMDENWMVEETKEYLSRPIQQRVSKGDTVIVIEKINENMGRLIRDYTVTDFVAVGDNKSITVSSPDDENIIIVPFNDKTRVFEDDNYIVEETYTKFEKEPKYDETKN